MKLCRTITYVCRSDKLRLVLNGGYTKNHPVRLRLPPLHRRGMVRHYTYTDTPQPPQRKALHFAICIRVLHNVTLIDLLAQSVILLRLPPLHRRGMVRHYTYTDTPQPPQRKALHFAICIRVLHNVTLIDLLAQSVILLRLPPLHRRGMVRHYTYTDTPQPPQRKALHFAICIRVLHNVTLIDLLAQSVILLRLPPLHRRGMVRHYTYTDTPQPPQRKALHFAICIRVLHNVTLIDLLAQSVILLRLPPLQRRGIIRPYTYTDTPQPPQRKALHFAICIRVLHNVTLIDLLAQSVILLRLPPLQRRGIPLFQQPHHIRFLYSIAELGTNS